MKRDRFLFTLVLTGALFLLFSGIDPCEAG